MRVRGPRRQPSPESKKNKEQAIKDMLLNLKIEIVMPDGSKEEIRFSEDEISERVLEELSGYTIDTLLSIIPARFQENVRNLDIAPEKWKRAVLAQPSLFYQSPETINKNIEGAAQLLGISKREYVRAALEQPQLFYQSPETINKNIEGAAQLLGIGKEEYVKAALKRPSLFSRSPETINKNIEEAAQLLGISKREYVKAALEKPQLFYQSPETINKNIEEAAQFVRCK